MIISLDSKDGKVTRILSNAEVDALAAEGDSAALKDVLARDLAEIEKTASGEGLSIIRAIKKYLRLE